MHKSKLTFTLLISLLINLIFSFYSFAQYNNTTEEIMTFETYYPAPFGVYNEMRSKKMAIGDNYYNGSQYCWSPATCSNQIDGTTSSCFPNCNTDLVVEGNVGIGTASPGSKLHVKLGAGIGTVALQGSAPNEGVDLQWYDYDDVVSAPSWSGTYKWDLSYRSGSISTPSDSLQLYNSVSVPVMTWTQAGNVGIGTTSPQDRIHVEGNATGDGGPGNVEIRVQNTGNAAAMIDLRGGGSGSRSYLIYSSGPGNVIGAGKLAIAAVGRVADLVVDASGNVGIKTTPQSTLHLYEEGANGAHIKLQAASGRGWNIISAGSASGAPAVGNFHIYEDGASATRIFIQKDTGNVGIGTTDPQENLQVAGTAYVGALKVVTLVPADSPQDVCRNHPTSGSWPNYLGGCTSSKKYKKDIEDLGLGLRTVMDLRPVAFNWLGDNSRDLGLVAEEVREVEPLLVTYDDKGELSGVKYKQLTAVLINAIKELNKRIEVLEAKKPKNK